VGRASLGGSGAWADLGTGALALKASHLKLAAFYAVLLVVNGFVAVLLVVAVRNALR
jgi:hypothetical protein